METEITENKNNKLKPHNIVVPFNIKGKSDIEIFDLNKIFEVNVNYNFDSLKLLLEGLISSLKKTQEDLDNLQAYNKVKDTKIKDLEQQLINLNNSLILEKEPEKTQEHNNNDNINNEKSETYKEVKQDNIFSEKLIKKINLKSTKKIKKIHAPFNQDLKLDIQIGNDEIINKIIKKVNGYDLCINDLYEAVPLIQKEQYNNALYIKSLEEKFQLQLNNLMEENNTLKKKFEENEDNFKDINIKLKEFDIVDILNNNSGEVKDKKVILGLISNLEKKMDNKIKLLEEKITKIDTTVFKTEKDAQDIKNNQNLNKRQIGQIKKQLEEINTKEENINKSLEQNSESINDKLEAKINDLEKNFKSSLDNLKSPINLKSNIETNKNKNLIKNSEEQKDNNNLIGLKKSIQEINKKIKQIINNNELEQIKADISALKSGINNYVLIPDFKEFKEISEDNTSNLRKIREEFEDFKNTQNVNTEILNIKLKLESVSNKVHDIVANYLGKKYEKNNYKTNPDDKYKFLQYETFEDFKSHVTKEFSNINDNFINTRKLLNELVDIIKKRTSFKDLKTLEEAMMSQMEELKILFSNKLADKNEVNRSLKYLDQQIKNIIQIYIKKIESGDNWLLSKKPISNNLCASCESYIGDLKDINNNNIYIPWNKYPVKDSNDKLYRMGNGYSKMLKLLEIDENVKRKEQIDNFIGMNKTEYSKGLDYSGKKIKISNEMKRTIQKSLPKLKEKTMKKINSTFTENNNLNINNIDSDEKEDEPKITKIFKKK